MRHRMKCPLSSLQKVKNTCDYQEILRPLFRVVLGVLKDDNERLFVSVAVNDWVPLVIESFWWYILLRRWPQLNDITSHFIMGGPGSKCRMQGPAGGGDEERFPNTTEDLASHSPHHSDNWYYGGLLEAQSSGRGLWQSSRQKITVVEWMDAKCTIVS